MELLTIQNRKIGCQSGGHWAAFTPAQCSAWDAIDMDVSRPAIVASLAILGRCVWLLKPAR
eukprot:scaffold324073_cov18-Prasinocladus_malaysianus.AAC.1